MQLYVLRSLTLTSFHLNQVLTYSLLFQLDLLTESPLIMKRWEFGRVLNTIWFIFEPNIGMRVPSAWHPVSVSVNLTQRRRSSPSWRDLYKHVFLYVCAIVSTKLLHRKAF